jgi:D-threo-aldose 1-dehydrogenase
MFANSFTIMQHPPELIRFMDSLASRYIGIINSALFHGGFLLGGRFFDYRLIDPSLPSDQQRLAWRQRFTETCAELGQSPFNVGVAFGRAHSAITAVALSSSRADRVPEHVRAASQVMPDNVWEVLRERGLIAAELPFL